MDVNSTLTPSEKLSQAVVRGMQEKKASEIVLMDLRNVKNAVADFFVLCTGNSDTQIDAIAESVDEQVSKELNEDPWHQEGKDNKEWMLIDYVNVVAHIKKRKKRDFYALETLWGDALIHSYEETP